MSVSVSMEAQFSVTRVGPDGARSLFAPAQLQEQCDAVMEALLELEDSGCAITDIAVAADAAVGEVTIQMVAIGDDFESAEKLGESCMRSAIHAKGGHTPKWGDGGTADVVAQNKRFEVLLPA